MLFALLLGRQAKLALVVRRICTDVSSVVDQPKATNRRTRCKTCFFHRHVEDVEVENTDCDVEDREVAVLATWLDERDGSHPTVSRIILTRCGSWAGGSELVTAFISLKWGVFSFLLVHRALR